MRARVPETFRTAARFSDELRPLRSGLVLATSFSLLTAVVGLLRPWPIQWIFDGALVPVEGLAREPQWYVWTGVAGVLFIALAGAALQYSSEVRAAVLRHTLTRALRHRMFAHLALLSPRFHARQKTGDLLVRLMGDVSMVSETLIAAIVQLVSRFALIAGTVGMMLWIDWRLTFIVLATGPLVLVLTRWLGSRITIAVRKQRRKEGELADWMQETIDATDVVQAVGAVEHVVRRFARDNRRSVRAGLKAKKLAARLSASVETVLGIGLGLTLLFGTERVLSGTLTNGELLVFLAYVRNLNKPVRSAARQAQRIAKGNACAERILSVLDVEPEIGGGGAVAPSPCQSIRFEDVRFSYDGVRPALRGVNLELKRGEFVGLVGHNGAGKSTIAALVPRLFDPDGGRIRFNGVPLDQLSADSVRERIGLCFQAPVLFGDTIRENLLLAAPSAEDHELLQACRAAGASEFLESLPDGLDTPLGNHGAGLSGGQRSRLALARALLRRPDVLIADEPFASLDPQAVVEVRSTLRRLAKTRLVLVVAHELRALETFDRIVVVADGKVVASGAHHALLRSCAVYRDLIDSAEEVCA